MERLLGLELPEAELSERLGSIDQLAGVRPVQLTDGLADGLRILEVRTGAFRFDVLAGRGLDIGAAEFRGIPIAWRSPTGDVAASHFETAGLGWLRSFHGGLLVGCGLRWMGARSNDGEEDLGLHGRLSNTPAEQVSVETGWQDGEYRIRIRGTVRETRVLREHILLRRTISTKLGQPGFEIEDVVTNAGFERTPHMLLYHMNLGHPLVHETSELVAPIRLAQPRDEVAAAGLAAVTRFAPPDHLAQEQVFFLDLAPDSDGVVHVGVVRGEPAWHGAVISFEKADFPYFGLWKMSRSGTYAVGLEPANALVEGLAVERARGRLQYLEPGESRRYKLRFGVLSGQDEIERLRDRVAAALTSEKAATGVGAPNMTKNSSGGDT
jgi:hypothetical protein